MKMFKRIIIIIPILTSLISISSFINADLDQDYHVSIVAGDRVPKAIIDYGGDNHIEVEYLSNDDFSIDMSGAINGGKRWSGEKEMLDLYMDGDNFEYLLTFKSKPDDSQFRWSVTGNVDLYYQGELKDTGNRSLIRPDWIIGSYAVYDRSAIPVKLGHIYAPYLYDQSGKIEKAIMSYLDGQIIITVPDSYFENAEYPVYLDPTFGYTDIGGSVEVLTANDLYGYRFTVPEDCNSVDSIEIYGEGYPSGYVKAVIVDLDEIIIDNGVSSASNQFQDETPSWHTTLFSAMPDLIPDQDYIFCFIPNTTNGVAINYDSGVEGYQLFDDSNSYSSPSNPNDAVYYDSMYSIKINYTAFATDPSGIPSDFVLSVTGINSVTANWTMAETDNAVLEISYDNSVWWQIYDGDQDSFEMVGLDLDSSEYYFRVKAYNEFGESAYTDIEMIGGEIMITILTAGIPVIVGLSLMLLNLKLKSTLIYLAVIACMVDILFVPEFRNLFTQAGAILVIILCIVKIFIKLSGGGSES